MPKLSSSENGNIISVVNPRGQPPSLTLHSRMFPMKLPGLESHVAFRQTERGTTLGIKEVRHIYKTATLLLMPLRHTIMLHRDIVSASAYLKAG